MPTAYPVQWSRGVHLPELDLWLDATRRREVAVVSHAHADHVAAHAEVICSGATARLIQHRLGARSRVRRVEHGEETRVGEAVVSLHPAGHVLGSSQVLIRHRDHRILYSGDLRLRPSRTAESLESVAADVLVVEATYGHPHYRFPPAAAVVAEIVGFCRTALADGRVPVLLAYATGKAQEVLAALQGSGLAVLVHERVAAMAAIYRDLGVDLPAAPTLEGRPGEAAGCVVVLPPHLRGDPMVERLGRTRMALISGWAVDAGTALRGNCHSAFPLSDHADFDELLEYVLRTGARRVLTVHGFAAELATQLRRRGVDASPIAQSEQLLLALA